MRQAVSDLSTEGAMVRDWKAWGLFVVAASSALAIAALSTWLLLEWITSGAAPRENVAALVGAALGVAFTVAGALAVTTWSAWNSAAERRRHLVRQIEGIARDAGRLELSVHSETLSDEAAGRLSRELAHHCARLGEALRVLDYVMEGRIDESYEVLASLFKVRRGLEWLNQPRGREGLSRLEDNRKAFEEMGQNPLALQISLRGISSDTDELRLRLREALRALSK